jgi:hypothetical protein
MKPNELPGAVPKVNSPGGFGQTVYSHAVRRLVDRFTYPAEQPVITLLIYYTLVVLIGAAAVRFVPGAAEMISGKRLAELGQAKGLSDATSTPGFVWNISLSMALSMIGAFVLMPPSSWVYMATRQKKGFDQQVVQTFIILSVAVAGVIIISRNSVALAFSLAGVVDALTAALVLSAIFNFIVLAMERMNYGTCALGNDPRRLLIGAAPPDPKKGKDFNAVLLVRTTDANKSRPAVEAVLGSEVRRFQLAEIEATNKGKGVLKYLIRMGKRSEPTILEDALIERCAPSVRGARIH